MARRRKSRRCSTTSTSFDAGMDEFNWRRLFNENEHEIDGRGGTPSRLGKVNSAKGNSRKYIKSGC